MTKICNGQEWLNYAGQMKEKLNQLEKDGVIDPDHAKLYRSFMGLEGPPLKNVEIEEMWGLKHTAVRRRIDKVEFALRDSGFHAFMANALSDTRNNYCYKNKGDNIPDWPPSSGPEQVLNLFEP